MGLGEVYQEDCVFLPFLLSLLLLTTACFLMLLILQPKCEKELCKKVNFYYLICFFFFIYVLFILSFFSPKASLCVFIINKTENYVVIQQIPHCCFGFLNGTF